MKRLGFILVGLVGLVALGCEEEEEVDSVDIRTHGMYAAMSVIAPGDGETDVTVDLRVGGDDGTIVTLVDTDVLTATVDGKTRTLKASDNKYKTTFDSDEGGVKYTISLIRGDDDDGAPKSVVTMPEKIKLEGDEYQSVSRADGELVIHYETTESGKDSMSWNILDSDCLFATDGKLDDSGELVLSGSDFNVKPLAEAAEEDPEDGSESCGSVVCLSREMKGTLDSAFGQGGYIKGIQRVCVEFTSVP